MLLKLVGGGSLNLLKEYFLRLLSCSKYGMIANYLKRRTILLISTHSNLSCRPNHFGDRLQGTARDLIPGTNEGLLIPKTIKIQLII